MVSKFPNIAVLLATYNGEAYLAEQLNSIFSQKDVTVNIFARDDGSSDSTVSILESYGASGKPVKILTDIEGGGTAAKNFKEIMVRAVVSGYDFVCFSDQDDIWLPMKLKRAVDIMNDGYDLYSSSLTTFSATNDRVRTLKGRVVFNEYDYLFQGLSAGCTYVLSQRFYSFVREKVVKNSSRLDDEFSHDWLIYTIARSFEYRIFHDPCSNILYRQHSSNVQGSLMGLQGVLYRLKNISAPWYYGQIILNREFIRCTPAETAIINAVESNNIFFIIRNFLKFRRSMLHCLALLVFLTFRKS